MAKKFKIEKIKQDDNTKFKIHYNKWADVEIGGQEEGKFKPEAKLKKWGDECFIRVSLPTTKDILPIQEKGKIKWKDTDKEVHLYPLEPTEQYEQGGFEYQIIEKAKSASNQITLDLDLENVKAYYQPPLTEEFQSGWSDIFQKEIVVTETTVEDLEGNILVHRPENVVDSIVFYHATKGNIHPVGEAEKYKTSKIGTLYRSKSIDSNGWKVWNKQEIKGGKLIITRPQDFIDNAVYPIRHAAGTNFGWTEIAGTEISSASDNVEGSAFGSGGSGTANSITFYLLESDYDDGPRKLGLWKDSDGVFVGGTAEYSGETPGDWVSHNLEAPQPSITDQTYRILHWGEEYSMKYDTIAGVGRWNSIAYPDDWPDPLTTYNHNNRYSIYCTYTPIDITYGTASEFHGKGSNYLDIAEIDTNKFVVAYNDWLTGQDGKGKVRVATVSGTTITWGDAVEFESGTTLAFYICKLATDKFVVCYKDTDDSGKGKAVVGTVSGTTITCGSPSTYSSTATGENACTQLATDKFVVAYQITGAAGKARVATVSGTIPTWGDESEFEDNWTASIGICKLSADKFVVCYREYETGVSMARAATVSDKAISWGTINQHLANQVRYNSCAQFGTDKFVLVYMDSGDSNKGKTKAATVAGTTITFGSAFEFESGATFSVDCIEIDSTHFVVVYSDDDDGDKGKSSYCSVNWSTKVVSPGTPEIWADEDTGDSSICHLGSGKISIAYRDNTNDKDKAIIGDILLAGVSHTKTLSETMSISESLISKLPPIIRYFLRIS